MHMITAADVIRAVETYFEGGAVSYLSEPEECWHRFAWA
jgi:hypothetical protein